jgi:hypothetical protein
LKKAVVLTVVLVASAVAFVSCSSSPSTTTTTGMQSGLKFRAFISNPLEPTGTGSFAQVLNIMDATLDELSGSVVGLTGTVQTPGLMAISSDKSRLLIFSSTDDAIAVVDTTTEALATSSGGGSTSSIRLPDATQSMVISPDDSTGYAAVPAAPVTTSPPALGAVVVFSLSTESIISTIPVTGARFVAMSHNGNRVLALGTNTCPDNTTSVTVIAPALIGTSQDPRTVICGFDHPVWAVFTSDDTTAYVLDCGPECGGTTAGVTPVSLNTNTAGPTVSLPGAGATIGLLNGSTLYVAGTPPGTACGAGTAAPTCGTLETVDISSMTVTSSSPTLITDGNHAHMELGANGQLFIGATSCSNVNTSTEVRGCLTIFDTNKSAVVIPPEVGDVTGIQPITNRTVVYICQNANFYIYDTTTDMLEILPPPTATTLVFQGQAIDVKLVD